MLGREPEESHPHRESNSGWIIPSCTHVGAGAPLQRIQVFTSQNLGPFVVLLDVQKMVIVGHEIISVPIEGTEDKGEIMMVAWSRMTSIQSDSHLLKRAQDISDILNNALSRMIPVDELFEILGSYSARIQYKMMADNKK